MKSFAMTKRPERVIWNGMDILKHKAEWEGVTGFPDLCARGRQIPFDTSREPWKAQRRYELWLSDESWEVDRFKDVFIKQMPFTYL